MVVAIERGETLIPNVGTLRKLAAVLGMTVEDLREQTGMYGPLYVPARADPARDAATHRRFSPRAEEIATLVDTLPVKEQELIATLCRYFRARRDVRSPERETEAQV
jgi:transcriptional regulator with XRE-family HTH domain